MATIEGMADEEILTALFDTFLQQLDNTPSQKHGITHHATIDPSSNADKNSYDIPNEPSTISSSLNNGKNNLPSNNIIITYFDKTCEINTSDPSKANSQS